MQSPGIASPKVLKLHARKQKAQNTQQQFSGTSSGLFSNTKQNLFQTNASNWSSAGNNIQNDSADVYERFDYLSKLKEENEVLVTLLKEIQLNKDELTKRMRELEMTRDAILSLRPSVTKDMIDNYLTDTCPLASKNRPSLNLTTNQSVQAREVYDRMLNVAGIFRTNQAELQDFLMQQLVTASDHFINDEFAACDRAIERMENVMRAGPRNVATAQELVKHLEESIFQASAEHFTQLLQEEVAKRNPMESAGFGESKHTDPSHQLSADHEALLEHQQSEIQELTTQNETLRQTVTELREKIAKLKTSTSSSAPGSASSSAKANSVYNLEELMSSNVSSPLPRNVEGASATTLPGTFVTEEKDTTIAHVLAHSPWIVSLLQDKFSVYVQQVVDGHPLANVFTASALQPLAAQITEELARNTGLTMFLALLKQQQSSMNNSQKDANVAQNANDVFLPFIEQLLTGQLSDSDAKQAPNSSTNNNPNNNEEDLFGIGVGDIPAEHNHNTNNSKTPYMYFEEIASQLLRLSVMHQEVACLATLLLTYLRERLQIVASPLTPGTPLSATNANNSNTNTNTNSNSHTSALNLIRPAVPVKSVTPTLLAATAAVKMRNAAAAHKSGNTTPNRTKPTNGNNNQYYYETPANNTNNTNNSNNNWHTADEFMSSPPAAGEVSEPYLYRTHSRDNSVTNTNNNLNVPRYMMPKNVAVTSGGAILPSRNNAANYNNNNNGYGGDNNSRAGSRR